METAIKSSRRSSGPRLVLGATGLAWAIMLGGCSSEGSGDWVSLFRAARDSWENRDAPVGLNDAAAIPYATLGVRLDDGREQILVLATDTNGDRLWTSSSRVAIATRNGRIVRTAGFGTDLSGYYSDIDRPDDWARPHKFAWNGDFSDLGIYAAHVVCDVAPIGPEPVTILGKEIDTVRVEETCRSEQLSWSFTNIYWVSMQSGRVWRAIQHVHPRGPSLEIEILRPPLSSG